MSKTDRMNKYQEALNFLDWHCEVKHDEQQKLLQELIDEATPKKVKNITNNVLYGDHHSTGYCPNCNVRLEISSNDWYHLMSQVDYVSCVCGQKLGWSEDDDL